MTTILNVHNVNEALAKGIQHIANFGKRETSRLGDVLVASGPVLTEYKDPTARVLFSPVRDANPFFHLMEALWMLAGRDDVAFVEQFVKRMREGSDDGETLHGAYGKRWRDYFFIDQLRALAVALRNDPTTRRAVLGMWSVDPDIMGASKDLPCNTHCYFDVRDGALNMTVMCRSNDMWWGAHGANAVHFSVLLEYMAAATGLRIGVLRQFSNNYHFYLDRVPERWRGKEREWMELVEDDCQINDRYTVPIYPQRSNYYRREVNPVPPVRVPLRSPTSQWDPATWQARFDRDVQAFMGRGLDAADVPYNNPFFKRVAEPMYDAHAYFKRKDYARAMLEIEQIEDDAWRIASYEWLKRREVKRIEHGTH